MSELEHPFSFPCEFPIKVFAAESSNVLRAARDIVERHAGILSEECISQRASSNGKYVAITFKVTATSREQLDEIYRDLTARDDVLMAL